MQVLGTTEGAGVSLFILCSRLLLQCLCRATGQELTFMTVDDIVTLPGYPRRLSPRHAQTMLVFYHNADSELCRAVNALGRRRRRRQASDTTWPTLQFTDYDRVVTNGLVDAAIANPA